MRKAETYRAARRNAARKKAYVPLRDLRKIYGYTRRQMAWSEESNKLIEVGVYS